MRLLVLPEGKSQTSQSFQCYLLRGHGGVVRRIGGQKYVHTMIHLGESMQRKLRFMKSSLDSRSLSESVPVVPVGTCLGDVFYKCIEVGSDHVLVVDEDGSLFGVASLAAIGDVLKSWDGGTIWFDRPVESIVMLSLSAKSTGEQCVSDENVRCRESECLTVFEDGELVAVMTENDSLMSWNRIEQAASHTAIDPVTLLPNRAHFDRRLAEEWDRALRLGTAIGVAMIDVDYFKDVNDQFGHNEGDRVLRSIADCCREQLRSYDLLARHGGDEFAAIFCAQTPEEMDAPIARLLSAVNELTLHGNDGLRLSLSIGTAIAHPAAKDCSCMQLVEAADACLYESKNSGRDQAHVTTIVDGQPARSRQIVATDRLQLV
jgi:diguanylate cyclase (GGDEF)-like protein